MIDIIVAIIITIGALFVLLAAIGLVRMPDTYLRISASTKAATLGIGLIMLSAAIYFESLAITTEALVIVLFIFLTAPIGAHLIGRASYFSGVKLWKNSVVDDLSGKYQRVSHELKSDDDDTPEDNIDHSKEESEDDSEDGLPK